MASAWYKTNGAAVHDMFEYDYLKDPALRFLALTLTWFVTVLGAILVRADLTLIDLMLDPGSFDGDEIFDLLLLVVVVVGPFVAVPLWMLNNLRVAEQEEERARRIELGDPVDAEPPDLPLDQSLLLMGGAVAGTLLLVFALLPFVDLESEGGMMLLAGAVLLPIGAAMNRLMKQDS